MKKVCLDTIRVQVSHIVSFRVRDFVENMPVNNVSSRQIEESIDFQNSKKEKRSPTRTWTRTSKEE
jgi:hypothetical protein